MNVILIGYRGTGKSSIAKMIGERLKWDVLCMDDEIVRRAGKPITEIVAEKGWDYFRDLESEVVSDFSKEDNSVLDCGGGVILRAENVENLKDSGKIFWLAATSQTIVSRICGDTQRPALTEGKTFLDEVEQVLEVRLPLYEMAADVKVETDKRTTKDIVEEILTFL